MHSPNEHVSLPDPDEAPLVHPLDVGVARGHYRRAWLVSLVGAPHALVALGAVSWAVTNSLTTPVAAVVSTGLLGEAARRHFAGEAWAHIPRRRQDVERPDPLLWRAVRGVLLHVGLVAGIVAVLVGLRVHGYAGGVRSYSLGAAAGVGLVLVGEALRTWSSRRSPAATYGVLAAVTSSAAGAAVVVAADLVPTDWRLLPTVVGAGLLVGIYGAWAWISGSRRGGVLSGRALPSD